MANTVFLSMPTVICPRSAASRSRGDRSPRAISYAWLEAHRVTTRDQAA